MRVRNPNEFRPTPAMELYAYQRAKIGDDASIKSVAEKVGVCRETATMWKQKPGFTEWLNERVTYYRTPILDLLEHVAVKNLDDFRYWEAMSIKYGLIGNKDESWRTQNLPKLVDKATLIDLVREARKAK